MLLLLIFAFAAGLVTVLSPCILPMLPLILSSSMGGTRNFKRPLGVVIGFVLSFTLFTLFLSALVRASGISPDTLRLISVIIIVVFGLALLLPFLQNWSERAFSKLSGLAPTASQQSGFFSGLILGFSLGLLWAPCVGPILAAVITLAVTGTVTWATFLITFAYALGTALPMLLIMWGGRELLARTPWLLAHTRNIQQAFGVLMILTALAILFNLDRSFQSYVITKFPQYGSGLTALEDRSSIRQALDTLQANPNSAKSGAKGADLPKEFSKTGVPAPELIPGGAWINSAPLTLKQLRGKVVIVDFWTYSCINCQRTLPYLKKWYERYADKGLVIIGVHAPEFAFEKNLSNLQKAVKDFDLKYPIMQDNDFATWSAYQNRFWPAKYFIDKDGNIRYTHFGEGGYDESERVIQELLKESGAQDVAMPIDNPEYDNGAQTGETYLGYQRLSGLASNEVVAPDQSQTYSASEPLPANHFAFSGAWTVFGEYAAPTPGAKLIFHFHAKKVFLVMRPHAGQSAQVTVLVDGQKTAPGADVQDGAVTVDADRLYELVNMPESGDHTLELQFQDGNAEAYAFTFG